MDVVVAPGSSFTALCFVLGGVGLGTVSGLVPGLHANNVALMLTGIAPAVPGPPLYVGMAMLAAGVVHTFLDVVPALTLGVPDPAMAVASLPGHRLVNEGRGREALRLSAIGSGLAVVFAVPLAIPVTRGMAAAWPTLQAHLPLVLAGLAALLILTERSVVARAAAATAFVASAVLGLATLDISPAAPLDAGGMLTPLFAGLFGAPVLVDAMDGSGVPPQDDPAIAVSRPDVAGLAALGTLAGAVVGYVPAVSSAIASTVALLAVPGRSGARGFVVTTSGVNTANAIFALFALVALGAPRTGVLVAVDEAGVPLSLPHLLAAMGIAAAIGAALVVTVGDWYLAVVGSLDPVWLSSAILLVLSVVSFLFAGGVGVAVYVAATVVGLVPPRFRARRANLMGVLMGPIILG